MNYELARQLKDAGFPQKFHAIVDESTYRMKPDYTPTLSELIEACGDDFEVLKRNPNGWYYAGSGLTDFPNGNRLEAGNWPTPEIAVAKLWLAINTK